MKSFVISLTLLLGITFSQSLYAQDAAKNKIPEKFHGSWIVDMEATVKNFKAQKEWKPEYENNLHGMIKGYQEICITFSEDKMGFVRGSSKQEYDVSVKLSKEDQNDIMMAYITYDGVTGANKVVMTKDGKLLLSSALSDGFEYVFKKGTLSDASSQDAAKGKILVVSGEKIAFLGDSITAAGANPGGYCQLVLDGLKKQGIEVSGIFAGISGHKSNQMLERLEKDVLSKKPDWMTLSCGVNDVWHGAKGVKLEDYKTNITAIVDKAQAAGVKVMILTSTMIKEDQEGDLNQQLLPYNAFLRDLAKSKGCLLADLNTDMQEAIKGFPKDAPRGNQLTSDGVHMNAYGNYMMAKGILKAFGVPESKFPVLVQEWKKIPGGISMRFRLSISMSQYEYEQLQSKLEKPLQEVFQECLDKKKEELLKK